MSLLPGKFYFEDFFDDFAPIVRTGKNEIKCDVYEKDGTIHIEMDAPGFKKEDIKVNIDDGILTIEASKEEEVEEKDKNYYRRERTCGTFKRQFTVGNVNEEEIQAEFNNGVLTISLPKEEVKDTKKVIEIK
ncbi:MAG: Hsp20 family protein [Tenericutes bacterium]|nr:Hsp20 family protein [Mycoplasmatota bacterium]